MGFPWLAMGPYSWKTEPRPPASFLNTSRARFRPQNGLNNKKQKHLNIFVKNIPSDPKDSGGSLKSQTRHSAIWSCLVVLSVLSFGGGWSLQKNAARMDLCTQNSDAASVV